MALRKEIRQEDGVITNYHRILYLRQTVNKQTSIAVVSYVDETARSDEQNSIIGQPYKQAITYEIDYDATMTIEKAYDFLKTLSQFENAEDI